MRSRPRNADVLRRPGFSVPSPGVGSKMNVVSAAAGAEGMLGTLSLSALAAPFVDAERRLDGRERRQLQAVERRK
jgi:hypothetical protein